MKKLNTIARVSVHGGHSGQFCNHAVSTLNEVVSLYHQQGFTWVGITEHMPPVSDEFLYPEEIEAGLNAKKMYDRFADYITTCRALQQEYEGQLEILVGVETDTYHDSVPFVKDLLATFNPDYIVGSVHHTNDIPIDLAATDYMRVAHELGGLDALYCRYFDQQYEMIEQLQPQVVGHFDYIRLFDPDYPQRLQKPNIWRRIQRNLAQIKALDLILDFNLSPLRKGVSEPYISKPILMEAQAMNIAVVPGDDSHGVDSVGLNLDRGMALLQDLGFDTNWRNPVR